MGPNCQCARGIVFLLPLIVSASLGQAGGPRVTFDASVRTPPRFGAVAPHAAHPFDSYYRPNQDAGYYRWRYPGIRDDLPEDYYQTYRPLAAYVPRRNYYNHAYESAPLYTGHPLRTERTPPVYNPYYGREYPRADSSPYNVFAQPWRYHSPYLSTRYYERVRPAWPRYRPSYTYFQSAIPSFSGFVSLPSRIYYPHFLHGSNAGSHLVGVITPQRHPSAEQFLVFIPDLEEMHQPDTEELHQSDLLAPMGDEEPVYQAGKPQQSVGVEGTGVSDGAVASPDDHVVSNDTDPNQSHGADDADLAQPETTTEEAAAETTLIYPTSAKDEVVSQSQDVNEDAAVANATAGEQMGAAAGVVHSTVKPTQSAGLAAEIAVTASSLGAGLSGENVDEIATESAAAEEEYAHIYATAFPETENSPDAVIKPLNQNEEVLAELEQTQENEASGPDAVTESLAADTTLPEEEEDDDDYQETVTQTTPTTEKAVYVQLHLLPQDNSSASTASPEAKVTTPAKDKENTSESSLFFLGEMPSDQPEALHHDRIYKRYSETKSQAKLSLDFKTVPVMPKFV